MAKDKKQKKSPVVKPPKKLSQKEIEAAGKKNHEDKQAAKKMSGYVHARNMPKGAKLMKVRALCNMSCLDGTQLRAGKVCEISEPEFKRLEADTRGPFFERP